MTPFARLQSELERAKSALEDHKVMDRHKGILMKAKSISEETGLCAVLREKTAMNENKKITDVQEMVITAAEGYE